MLFTLKISPTIVNLQATVHMAREQQVLHITVSDCN